MMVKSIQTTLNMKARCRWGKKIRRRFRKRCDRKTKENSSMFLCMNVCLLMCVCVSEKKRERVCDFLLNFREKRIYSLRTHYTLP